MSLQEATSACHGSQHPHSTFLDGGIQGPQTLPAASPPHPNTPRTLHAAPQILLTCSWLPHFARTVPFTRNTFPHLLHLEKSSSSPKAKAQIGEGGREGGRGYHIFPPATCQAPSKGRLLSASPTAARAPISGPFYRWGTWGYLLRVAQCQRGHWDSSGPAGQATEQPCARAPGCGHRAEPRAGAPLLLPPTPGITKSPFLLVISCPSSSVPDWPLLGERSRLNLLLLTLGN